MLGALLLGVSLSAAAFDIEAMPTPAMQKRYDGLTHELRCMQCQNQSIADSPVGLAEDLRRDVREQIIAGKTDAEIRDVDGGSATATSSCSARRSSRQRPGCGSRLSCCCSCGVFVAVRIVRKRSSMVASDDSVVDTEEPPR